MGMTLHSICTGSKVVQAMGTDKAQVVMHSLQMVYHHPLILPLLATPKAEGQATLPSQGLRGMNPLQAHYFQ